MEDCCRGSLLSLLPSLLLLLQLPAGGSAEDFVVIGSSEPIVAMLGGDIMLPCRVFPAMNVENMELRWFRSKFSEAVFIYQNQQEQREEQLAQYTGRTSLVKEFLTWGEAILHIQKVQAFDNGVYNCFFRKGSFYESASLELKVAGRLLIYISGAVALELDTNSRPRKSTPHFTYEGMEGLHLFINSV
ncbi:myelin-oligodendrocyte glycoprotein-like [Ursus maritimus]|uniref:Myelin-oligodendrocyte glycoprotein-like n=1 Tax=Ursus maritimus TaxID=29073 RepID=A0A384DSS9_URSMA|nr:myelin-oligodendrocyte glycoprotein-like [Ursus maritimus]XP_040500725.1 myelin-oligodendrocyte glycoprotein-like [Ursus maritimus]